MKKSRIKLLLTVMLITTFVLTTIVAIASWLSGKAEIYDIGVNLITTGIILMVLSMPLFYRSHHRARIRIHLHLPIDERNKIVPDTYYDYFAGITFSSIATVATGFLLIALANYFGQRSSQNTTIPIIGSARQKIEEMQEIASQHYDDAHLVNATYYFSDDKPYIVISQFESVKNPSQSILITLDNNGEYITKFYETSSSIDLSISDDDWLIDSQEALQIFAQDENIKACINYSPIREKYLKLTRVYSMDNHDVKWCISIEECSATKTRTCIDANTGEKLLLD